MSDSSSGLALTWQPAFRHSAGVLNSHYLRALRDGKLLGWKTDRLGVTIPPIEAGGPGDWVEVGPGATLQGYVLPADGDGESREVFAVVRVDGADTPLYALVLSARPETLRVGARLRAVAVEAAEGGSPVPVFEMESPA